MKKLLMASTILAISTSCASAYTRVAKVIFVEDTSYTETSYIDERVCRQETITTNGGSPLAGALIGGALGNQFGQGQGKDAMTFMGALIGMDHENRKRKTSRVENVCEIVSRPVQNIVNGYVIYWKRDEQRGYFFSDFKYPVGDNVYVDVNN